MSIRALTFGVFLVGSASAKDAPPVVTSAPSEPQRAIQVAEAPSQPRSPLLDQVTSASTQFRVGGGEDALRASVATLAEETKSELLRLTQEKDDHWKVPITITLYGKVGDPVPAHTVNMRLLENEDGYHLEMDIYLARGIEQDRFKYATTAALIYERCLRERKKADDDRPLFVPPWLADGILEATAWRLDRSDRRLYEALFKSGGLFKIEDLFSLSEKDFDNLDGASRAAFRVSSGALVMALLDQPHGEEGFRKFLTEVAGFEGDMPALMRKDFPALNLSQTSLAKWWALQIAAKGSVNPVTDILSIDQTESALGEALKLNFRTVEGINQQKNLSAWPELALRKPQERLEAIHLAQDALVRLSYRCFPSYRPLLMEYQLILTAIAQDKTKDITARLAALQQTRLTMKTKATRARDYLDWFEITRARDTSGVFDDYIRLKDQLKAGHHFRNDEISKYLDQMDALFNRDVPKNSVISR